jgi:hypothetical protein
MTDVIVYGDRAEIKRELTSELRDGGFENGSVEIVVTNLPESIDKSSVRLEGNGLGTIVDLKYETIFPEKGKDGNETKASKSLEERRKKLNQKRAVVDNLRDMLDGAAKVLGGTCSDPTVDMDKMKAFYDFYMEKHDELAQRSSDLSKESKICTERNSTNRRKLSSTRPFRGKCRSCWRM